MNRTFSKLSSSSSLLHLAWMLSLCFLISVHSAAGQSAQKKSTASNLIVHVSSKAIVERFLGTHHLNGKVTQLGDHVYEITLPQGVNAKSVASQLGADPKVGYADADDDAEALNALQFSIAFDAGNDSSGYVDQYAYQQINFDAGSAAAPGPGVGNGVIVAVLDTGATFSHPALSAHYISGYNMIDPGTSPDDIADGQTNVAQGHGTFVAGEIALIDPSARIMPIRVMNGDGVGSVNNVVAGIYYAIANGAQVINMSFGGPKLTHGLKEALEIAYYSGVICVAAAGNDSSEELHYPAAGPGVFAVTSLEADDTLSGFANYGPQIWLDAPGDGIYSTYYTGGYAAWSGTSFAAPFVTGEAALLIDLNPGIWTWNVDYDILGTAVSVDSLNPNYAGLLGKGIINIGAATGL